MADQEFVTMATDRFNATVASAVKAAAAYENINKGGATFLDSFRKSDDPQVVDIRKQEEALTVQAQALRDQARTRLVEIGVLKASAATSEESAKNVKAEAFDKVRKQLAAMRAMFDDEPELIASLEASVIGEGKLLGKPRGRAAGQSDSSDTADSSDTETEETTSDETEDSSDTE
jgi:hypothetical protein